VFDGSKRYMEAQDLCVKLSVESGLRKLNALHIAKVSKKLIKFQKSGFDFDTFKSAVLPKLEKV